MKPSKHALWFILATILIDSIGFGIILPVAPDLIMEVAAVDLAEATRISGWLLVLYALLQFVCGPLMGNLGDRFGRRPVLLGSLACFALDYLFMALAPNLAWLFVGRAVAGIAGAVYGPANAYIADITPPEERAARYGLVGAAFGFGFIFGPAIGGLVGELGPRAPFYAAAAIGALNFIYGWFVLPESLPPERRRKFEWARANPFGTMKALGAFPSILPMFLVLALWDLAHHVYPTTWSFFAKARFDWAPWQIGLSLAYAGLTMVIVQGWLTGKIVPRIGEARALAYGIIIGAAHFLGLAFATQGWMIYAIMTVGALDGLIFPAISALLSRAAPDDQQGELQGGIASIHALTAIAGPWMMSETFARFTERDDGLPFFPGAAFILATVLALLALAVYRGRGPVMANA
jgi:DHA1 family tetracycline resistance protein-like MFS transporter